MNEIKLWALNLCAVLLLTALINYLVPKGNVKKICETAFSIIILAVFCVPFFGMKNIDTTFQNTDIDSFMTEKFDYSSSYDEAIKTAIEKVLDDNKIGYSEITVQSKTENGEYILEKVNMTLEKAEDAERAASLIRDNLKIDDSIIFTGD